MLYRVVLLSNGEYKKTLHRCRTRETVFINYHKIKNKNKVYFPKQFINTDAIKPVKYEIAVTKVREETDKPRILRDKYGKTYSEPFLGDWIILDSSDYFIEETFWIHGHVKIGSKRPTIKDILEKIMKNAGSKKLVKQVIVVNNKMIIYNEEQFDMVICKNTEDAQRLHHTLAKICSKQKIKTAIFMGTASELYKGRMYDLIHEKTKWPYIKIWRTTTRP